MHCTPLDDERSQSNREPQRYWVHDPPTSGHALTLYQSLSHPWVKCTPLALGLGYSAIGYGSKPLQKTLPTCIGKHISMPTTLMMITSTHGSQSPVAINLAEGAKNPWVTSLGKTTLNI